MLLSLPSIEGNQSVYMLATIHTDCIRSNRLPDHPAHFAMADGSNRITIKIKICRKDKIPGNFFIGIMELVFIKPDVST